MPDWRWQLEQFEEEQRPDDKRLPFSTTRPFLHPRRRVTSVFSGLPLHCVAHYPIRLPATRTTRARHTLLLPAIPVHWLPRLAHLPYDLFVHSLLFVKLTAYDSRQQLSPDTRLLSLPLRLPLYPRARPPL